MLLNCGGGGRKDGGGFFAWLCDYVELRAGATGSSFLLGRPNLGISFVENEEKYISNGEVAE